MISLLKALPALVVVGAVVGGCSVSAGLDIPAGSVAVGGTCASDVDCNPGDHCDVDGLCVAMGAVTTCTDSGVACSTDSDCENYCDIDAACSCFQ